MHNLFLNANRQLTELPECEKEMDESPDNLPNNADGLKYFRELGLDGDSHENAVDPVGVVYSTLPH